MTPAAGSSSRQKVDTEAARQGAYQEIHAAILELYRLMGVPRSLPQATAGAPFFPGYSVYTYPVGPTAPRYQPLGAPCVSAWTAPVANGPAVLNHYTQPSPTYVQQAVPHAVQTWAMGAF